MYNIKSCCMDGPLAQRQSRALLMPRLEVRILHGLLPVDFMRRTVLASSSTFSEYSNTPRCFLLAALFSAELYRYLRPLRKKSSFSGLLSAYFIRIAALSASSASSKYMHTSPCLLLDALLSGNLSPTLPASRACFFSSCGRI